MYHSFDGNVVGVRRQTRVHFECTLIKYINVFSFPCNVHSVFCFSHSRSEKRNGSQELMNTNGLEKILAPLTRL